MEIKTRPITKAEKQLAQTFQAFLIPILKYNKDQYKSQKSMHDLYEGLEPYHSKKFARPVIGKLSEVFEIEDHNKRQLEVSLKLNEANKQKLDQAIQEFSNGNLDFNLSFKSVEYKPLHIPPNFLKRSGLGSFFSGGKTKSILESFDDQDMQDIVDADLNGRKTYLSLNLDEPDWQKYAYFVQHLTDDDTVTLSADEKITWLKYNSNPERELLFKLVDDYQYNNDKRHVEKIMSLIERDQDVKALNAPFRQIKTVYRGIASDDIITSEFITQQDRETKYVSTTPDRKTALQFSERRGHLDKEANSKHSYIITYQCKPKAIQFVTDIFGRVFGEVDYVLDATKATAKVTKVR